MSASKAGRFFSLLKWTFGLGAIALEAALLFLLVEPTVGRAVAWTTVALGVLVVPMGLTSLLVRAFKKTDSGTTYWKNLPGTAAIAALLALSLLLFFARGPASSALLRARDRYPHAPRPLAALAHGLGEVVAPDASPARPRTSRPVAKRPPPAARDAGRSAPVADAGRTTIAKPPDAAPPRDAGSPPPADAGPPGPALAGSIAACDSVRSIFAVDLGQEPTDEIVVACDDGVHVLWPRPDGSVQERTRFALHAPEGLELVQGEPRVVDLDVDGSEDVVLCAYWTTPAGGTRGGDTWWARGAADGQFVRPTRLVGGYCAGIDTGDVDGDGEAELVIAHVGNPWQQNRPDGELRWFERARARWTPRGRWPLEKNPQGLRIADVNGDAYADVVVRHSWNEEVVRVLPGSAAGPLAIDAALQAPPAPSRTDVAARLDGDDRPDRLRAAAGGIVEVWRTGPEGPLRPVTRALDYREYQP